MAGSKECSTHG